MYKVIAANRGPSKPPKNWRIFERESMEKHFGPVLDVNGEDGHSVLDAYEKYKDTLEYIRWYPCPESCTDEEYKGILSQDSKINLPYLTNSAKGFLAVQSKEVCFQNWKDTGVNCPDFFTYENKEDFYKKFNESSITYPFLIRVNNSVGGKETYIVREEKELESALDKTYSHNQNRIGIDRKMMCVNFVNTIDRDVNVSYRIHVAGNKVISGYGRVVPKDNWLAITAGSFRPEQIDNWVYYNKLCEQLMREREEEIVKAVHSLKLNHQGVDVVMDEDTKELCFLEVQPTYASGYPQVGWCGYHPPFYNPSDPNLVQFLQQNKSVLEKEIPMYYYNWLDKKNHFDLIYKELKEYVRT
jgi:D-alanine-D-alanine ligase-like ATP-grasp enzyme